MKTIKLICLIIVLAALCCTAIVPISNAAAAGDGGGIGEPKTVYVSTADYQYFTGYPMDSVETVKANLETLKDRFNADTIWWRGFQDDLVLQTHVIRPEYRRQYDWWMWVKHLNYDVGTNNTVTKVAHDLGMKVWAYTALFDWGSQADAGFGVLPYTIEYKLRVEHPEYAPVNKYGTRLLGGPVEFCYPEVRKTVINDLVGMAVRNKLDGVMLYTYAENMTLRYFDEFGFNKPIVNEYKRRYGVNILKQDFDKVKLAKLRGEYVTLFLKELHTEFTKRGIKLGVQLDQMDSHLPRLWGEGATIPAGYSSPEWQARPAGDIYLDWEKWVKDGLVEELSVFPSTRPQSDALVKNLLTATKNTNIKVSQWKSKGDMVSSDVQRVCGLSGDETMCGFGWETNAEWGPPIENLSEQPLSNLKSDDKYARRRVLYMISRGLQTAPVADLIAATKDPDVFARIYAVRTLGAINDPAALSAIEEALLDPENSVRIEAVYTLAKNPGIKNIAKILDAMWRENSTWQFNYIAVETVLPGLAKAGKITPEDVATLLSKAEGLCPRDRRLAFNTLRAAGLSTDPRVKAAALRALKDDSDEYVQEYAIQILTLNQPTQEIIDALSRAVKEKGDSIQVRAAVALLGRVKSNDPTSAVRKNALADVVALFKKYGDNCSRSDKDWGWHEVGYSINDLGDDGRKILASLMSQRSDHRLADNAWNILYIKQDRSLFVPATSAEDAAAHAVRPK